MGSIEKFRLPEEALLRHYSQGGHFADCYSTVISRPVTQSQYVAAFYTTILFKVERLILKWAVAKPSTDAEALQLAEAKRNTFAAWSVEARDDEQLLLCDYQSKTRSWLMVEPMPDRQTRLYFGSAVVQARNKHEKITKRKFGFGLLLKFHKMYSIALLYCAKKRLERTA